MTKKTPKIDAAAIFRGAAAEIARMPGVAGRLRALHVAGPDGRCRGCHSALGVAPSWPCTLRALADADVTALHRPPPSVPQQETP